MFVYIQEKERWKLCYVVCFEQECKIKFMLSLSTFMKKVKLIFRLSFSAGGRKSVNNILRRRASDNQMAYFNVILVRPIVLI